jgi:hypothetical protein
MENTLSPIIAGLLGIAGTLAGILVTEYFKRKERVSLYSDTIFKKKLDAYEKLYFMLQNIYAKADALFADTKLSLQEKHAVWQPASLEIANYLDKHSLYINDDIAAHCMSALIAVDDYLDMSPSKRDLKQYYEDRQATYRLIKEDSGIGRINNFFNMVNKPKIKSEILDYINEVRKKQKKNSKKLKKTSK